MSLLPQASAIHKINSNKLASSLQMKKISNTDKLLLDDKVLT